MGGHGAYRYGTDRKERGPARPPRRAALGPILRNKANSPRGPRGASALQRKGYDESDTPRARAKQSQSVSGRGEKISVEAKDSDAATRHGGKRAKQSQLARPDRERAKAGKVAREVAGTTHGTKQSQFPALRRNGRRWAGPARSHPGIDCAKQSQFCPQRPDWMRVGKGTRGASRRTSVRNKANFLRASERASAVQKKGGDASCETKPIPPPRARRQQCLVRKSS